MVGTKDLVDLLDKIPLWKRLTQTPARIDELEKRVAKLEELLQDTRPPEVCPYCGKRGMRLYHSFGFDDKGVTREEWKCELCGKNHKKSFKPR